MKILITPHELIERGCCALHTGPYETNGGPASNAEELTLTEEQAVELGIIPKRQES